MLAVGNRATFPRPSALKQTNRRRAALARRSRAAEACDTGGKPSRSCRSTYVVNHTNQRAKAQRWPSGVSGLAHLVRSAYSGWRPRVALRYSSGQAPRRIARLNALLPKTRKLKSARSSACSSPASEQRSAANTRRTHHCACRHILQHVRCCTFWRSSEACGLSRSSPKRERQRDGTDDIFIDVPTQATQVVIRGKRGDRIGGERLCRRPEAHQAAQFRAGCAARRMSCLSWPWLCSEPSSESA